MDELSWHSHDEADVLQVRQGAFPVGFFAELDFILPQLTSIDLSGHGLVNIDDNDAVVVGQRCSNLETLTVGDCGRLTPAGYKAIIENCQRLRSVLVKLPKDVTMNRSVLESILSIIARNCPFLEDLTIHKEGRCEVEPLTACPSLGLLRCKKLCLSGLAMVEADFALLAQNTTLESLHVSTGVLDDFCMLALAQGCQGLKELKIQSRIGGDDDGPTHIGIGALSHAPFSRTLESISIECSGFDDDCLEQMSRFTSLQSIELVHSFKDYTRTGLAALLTGCRFLRSIQLGGYGVENSDLRAIGAGCPLLERLVVPDGVDFSVAALRAVFSNCPALRELDIGETTDTVITCIAHHVPRLEILHVCGEANDVSVEVWNLLRRHCPSLRHIV